MICFFFFKYGKEVEKEDSSPLNNSISDAVTVYGVLDIFTGKIKVWKRPVSILVFISGRGKKYLTIYNKFFIRKINIFFSLWILLIIFK